MWNGTTSREVVRICEGVFVHPNFMQACLDEDPQSCFDAFLAIPEHPIDEEIRFCPTEPFRITGAHKSLNYRGKAIPRHKVWAQSNIDDGLVRYGYTGWQWTVANATVDVASIPFLDRIRAKLQQGLAGPVHNHWILTLYKDGTDNIGAHSVCNPNSSRSSLAAGVAP